VLFVVVVVVVVVAAAVEAIASPDHSLHPHSPPSHENLGNLVPRFPPVERSADLVPQNNI
jgi:hypothetical protein